MAARRAALGGRGPLDPSLAQTASWRALSELLVCDVAWLATLAETPMPALRRLVVDARDGSLAALAAAVAASPALEDLIVFGEAVLELPRLVSPTLQLIGIGLGELADPVDDPPPGWFNTIAAALARCELPALHTASIEATIESGMEV
ncbi:hypothetical protein [Nannocystis pusilla]|uniref:hypothetical protein n=1 Tax=Nannocystis pusilla TaxID=889268 RepID=UPI003B7F36B7